MTEGFKASQSGYPIILTHQGQILFYTKIQDEGDPIIMKQLGKGTVFHSVASAGSWWISKYTDIY